MVGEHEASRTLTREGQRERKRERYSCVELQLCSCAVDGVRTARRANVRKTDSDRQETHRVRSALNRLAERGTSRPQRGCGPNQLPSFGFGFMRIERGILGVTWRTDSLHALQQKEPDRDRNRVRFLLQKKKTFTHTHTVRGSNSNGLAAGAAPMLVRRQAPVSKPRAKNGVQAALKG